MSKIRRLAPLLVGLSVAWSGCVSEFGSGTTKAVTAKVLLERAEELAAMGHDDGLLAVFTLETASGDAFLGRAPPPWLQPFLNHTDESVGDGRAPAWGYYFGSPMMSDEGQPGHAHDGTMGDILVIVGADNKELFRGAVPSDFPVRPTGPLGANWSVDSDVAATMARDVEWMSTIGAQDAYSFASLAIRIGSPAAWLFEAGRADSGIGESVAADARDGLKINLGNRDPFAPVKTESGDLSGTATTSGTSDSFVIEFSAHRQLEFFLDIGGGGGGLTQTGAQLEFVAKGPGGQAFPFHWDGSGGTNQAWYQFEAPNPGQWTLEARLVQDTDRQETSQAFAVHWCALGATRC